MFYYLLAGPSIGCLEWSMFSLQRVSVDSPRDEAVAGLPPQPPGSSIVVEFFFRLHICWRVSHHV